MRNKIKKKCNGKEGFIPLDASVLLRTVKKVIIFFIRKNSHLFHFFGKRSSKNSPFRGCVLKKIYYKEGFANKQTQFYFLTI